MLRIAALISLSFFLSASTARAEDAADDARTHFDRGRTLEAEGNLAEALSEYERAMELRPTFRLRRFIGRVCRGLGRYSEAIEHFQLFLSEGAGFLDAEEQREAQETLAGLRARVCSLRIETNEGATLLLDGRDVGRAPLAEALILEPGVLQLEVRLEGYVSAARELVLEPGGTLAVVLVLEAAPPPVTPEPEVEPTPDPIPEVEPEVPEAAPTEEPRSRRSVHRGWFWSTLALGTSMLISGGIMAGLALNRHQFCEDNDVVGRSWQTELQLQEARSDGRSYAVAADVLLFSGGAVAITAIVLAFFTNFGGSEESSDTPTVAPAPVPGGAVLMVRGAL